MSPMPDQYYILTEDSINLDGIFIFSRRCVGCIAVLNNADSRCKYRLYHTGKHLVTNQLHHDFYYSRTSGSSMSVRLFDYNRLRLNSYFDINEERG
jgi:hypothetical protein